MTVEMNNIAATNFGGNKRIAVAAFLEHVRRNCLRMRVRGKLRTLGPWSKLKRHSLFAEDRAEDRAEFSVNVFDVHRLPL